MQPENQYPVSLAMYPEKVLPPTVPPIDISNPATFDISCEWYPYIVGALKCLRQAGTWLTVDNANTIQVLDYVDTLLEHMTSVILESCSAIYPPYACGYNFVTGGASGWDVMARNVGDLAHPYADTPTIFRPFAGRSCYETGGNDYWRFIAIQQVASTPYEIDRVTVEYSIVLGDNFNGDFLANANTTIQAWNAGVFVALFTLPQVDLTTGDNQFFTWNTGGIVADEIDVTILAGVSQNSPAAGDVVIQAIEVSGNLSSGAPPCA